MTILEQIVLYKLEREIPDRLAAVPLAEMQARARQAPPAFSILPALRRAAPQVSLIAEIKKASPSKGLLCPHFDALRLADTYVAHGAAALSVLTDEPFFQGSLGYLPAIRQRYPAIPLLRKDFIVHPYQVYEARAAQADAILLIAAVLPQAELKSLLALTHELGMEALIEVHSLEELQRVLPLGPRLVGVNNRNLHDFSVSLQPCLTLRPHVPNEVVFVAESGIHTQADVARLAEARVDAMLIGEALVTAPDPGAKIKELTDAC